MKRVMATIGSVLWMVPVTITLIVFAGIFAAIDAVKKAPIWENDEDDED